MILGTMDKVDCIGTFYQKPKTNPEGRMKIRLWLSLVIMLLVLTACAPVAATPTEIPPTSTEMPAEATKTSIPTETPTITPTITPTSIPTLEGLSISVPDPRITNPDFFDVSNANSPIVQFAEAFAIKPEDVVLGLDFEVKQDIHENDFVVMRTSDGVALTIAQQGENGDWVWQEATPGSYWHIQGKLMGVYVNNEEFDNSREILRNNFSNGIMSLEEQIRTNAIPYRPPSRADRLASEAQANNMSLLYHYVAEPGKFPSGVDTKNIDAWLDTRLQGIIQVVKSHKTEGRPAYISFNEAWEGNVWNPEFNPLRSKYGNDKWIEEYITKLLSKFVNSELVPNQDFVIVFNDANLYNRPKKQDMVFDALSLSRQEAFNRVTSDPVMREKLNRMGINNAEGIQILLGTETHTKLGSKQDDGNFWPAPTDEQLTNLSEKFSPLGGIIMTEVNPFGTQEEKQVFLKRMALLLEKLPYFKGMIFWNVFKDSDDGGSEYPLSADPLLLFNYEDGSPAALYYALLFSK